MKLKIEKEMWAVITPNGEIKGGTIADNCQSCIWIFFLEEGYFQNDLPEGYTCQKVKVTIEVIEH